MHRYIITHTTILFCIPSITFHILPNWLKLKWMVLLVTTLHCEGKQPGTTWADETNFASHHCPRCKIDDSTCWPVDLQSSTLPLWLSPNLIRDTTTLSLTHSMRVDLHFGLDLSEAAVPGPAQQSPQLAAHLLAEWRAITVHAEGQARLEEGQFRHWQRLCTITHRFQEG